MVGDLRAVRRRGARGVRVRSPAQPLRRASGSGSGGPATTSTRSTAPRSRVPRRSTRPPRSQPSTQRRAPARGLVEVDLDERKERVTAARRRHGARTATCSRCCWSGRSASRGGWPAPTSTAASTASAGTSRRSTASSSGGRDAPLPGPVSNIASWNYPMSVQVHAELVQALAGNAVVAKTPTQGGFHCLTLAHAFMARAGLPVTLLSGSGVEARRRADQHARHRRARLRRRPLQRPRRGDLPRRHASAGTSSSRRASTPGASGTSRSGRCWPSTSARASSTPSSGAPPTRASSCSAGCCRRSSRRTCRCWTISASATRSPSPPRTTRCPSWTSGP